MSLPPIKAGTLADATGDYAAAGLSMTAERFHELRIAAGMSFAELADALRLTGLNAISQLREMERGKRDVTGPIGVAMQALADGWRPGEWPDAEEIDFLIEDCTRLAEHPNARPLVIKLPGLEDGGYNGLGMCFLSCARMLRRLAGRGA